MSSEGTATVSFDSSVFDLDTVKKSAYKFSDLVSFDIRTSKNEIVCELTLLDKKTTDSLENIVKKLKNEILDQDLRKKIFDETEIVRNVILAHVFSNTGLQDG